MFNCFKIKNERTYISKAICGRGLVYLKFPRLLPLVLWKRQQEKGWYLLHSFIGCQIPLHRQYNLHYNDESVNVSCKTCTQHTHSAHTLLSIVHFIYWYIQKHRQDALTFAAVHLSLFFFWRLKRYHRTVMVKFLKHFSSLNICLWWWNS